MSKPHEAHYTEGCRARPPKIWLPRVVLRQCAKTIVAFRSAKERSFAERKATIRRLVLAQRLSRGAASNFPPLRNFEVARFWLGRMASFAKKRPLPPRAAGERDSLARSIPSRNQTPATLRGR